MLTRNSSKKFTNESEANNLEPIKAPELIEDPQRRFIKAGTIYAAEEGTYGYTLPWAITVLADGQLWINGVYPLDDHAHSTYSLLVKRVEGGVLVDRAGLDRKQLPHDKPWGRPALPVLGYLEHEDIERTIVVAEAIKKARKRVYTRDMPQGFDRSVWETAKAAIRALDAYDKGNK